MNYDAQSNHSMICTSHEAGPTPLLRPTRDGGHADAGVDQLSEAPARDRAAGWTLDDKLNLNGAAHVIVFVRPIQAKTDRRIS